MGAVLSVTEDVMQRIRMVSAALMTAIAMATAMAATATAQAATTDQAGQPLPLLAGLPPPRAAKPAAAATTAATNVKRIAVSKHVAKHVAKNAIHAKNTKYAKLTSKKHYRIAAADTEEPSSPPSPTASPTWPVADTAALADSASATPPESAPADATSPSAVVVGGQTVQVVASNEVNQIDLAADDETATAAARFDGQGAAPAPQTVFAAPAHEDGSRNQAAVGSASWFAQVLAALGGAFAAGTVAWFLIGSGPVRTYG